MIIRYSQLKLAMLPEGKRYNTRAIKVYGLTEDPSSIGFITPEGRKIDSSGRSQGSGMSGRIIDHREIASAGLGEDSHLQEDFEDLSDMLAYFIWATGNIRVINTTNSELNLQLCISNKPTSKQMFILESLGNRKTVYYDLTNKDGHIVKSGEGKYYEFIADLNKYLKTESDLQKDQQSGKVPRLLQPLVDFIIKNNLSKEGFHDARYNRDNPLGYELRKVLDRCEIGVSKIWSDFGYASQQDFYEKVIEGKK